MNFNESDYKKYVEIYLNNKKMGIDFDALFEMAKSDLMRKDWLLSLIHNNETKEPLPFIVDEMINDYTMHLLIIFYMLNSSNDMFSYVNENFIKEYVQNESEIEGVDNNSVEGKMVREGLEKMYRYIHSNEIDTTTGSIILTDLHEKLYSHTEYGMYAREYRSEPVIHFFGNVDVPEPRQIFREMLKTDTVFDELYSEADKIYRSEIEDRMHMINPFLEKLMRYSVEVIRIQPFFDGNKRSTRGIVNYLLERAGLPPVYVKVSEDRQYKDALEDAMIRKNYVTITNFYKNKLCDSIEELIINPFEESINRYKERQSLIEKNKLDGKNADRIFKKELNLVKPKEE